MEFEVTTLSVHISMQHAFDKYCYPAKIGGRGQKRKHWLKEEDDAIVVLVGEYGTKQWMTVSKMMKSRFGIK